MNLIAIAAANQSVCTAIAGNVADPCKATFDPQVVGMLNKINDAMQKTGVISNTASAMTVSYSYQSPATLLERQPTGPPRLQPVHQPSSQRIGVHICGPRAIRIT